MIYQLYKKQVEAWRERFTGEERRLWKENTVLQALTDIEQDLLSSRHQDTIELLEAEIERKKGMKKYPTEDQEESLEFDEGWDSAIDEDIAYLEEQLALIQKETR